MALSDSDLEKIKYFLGYTNLTTVAQAYADIPAIFETVIRGGLSSWAETQVTGTILPNLVQLDVDIYGARSRYKVTEIVGEAKLDPNEHQRLLGLRDYWITQLEHVTGMRRNTALAIGGACGGTEVY
jgi:hypothetical protein